MLVIFGPAPLNLIGSDAWSDAQDDEFFESYTFAFGNRTDALLGAVSGSATGTVQGPSVGNATIKQQADIAPATPGTLTTTAIATNVSGSAFLVGLARGNWSNTNSPATKTPSDSPGNALAGIIGPNAYSGFPDSQQAIYYTLSPAGVGSATHTVSASYGLNPGATVHDEQTQFLIEIIGAEVMTTSSYVERVGATTITSNSVTVSSGPCLLIAVVWGTGGTGVSHIFTSTSGMTKISGASAETDFNSNGYIQCSTFWQYQDAPGTFTASFQGQNTEGAAIYLIALQSGNNGRIVLDDATSSATGTVTASGASGALGSTLASLTDTATGTAAISGIVSRTLGAVTDTAAGTVTIAGSGSSTLGAIIPSAAGAIAVQGAGSTTLGPLTDTAAGTVAVTGVESSTLSAATATATATATIAGVESSTLDAATSVAAAAVSVVGSTAATLDTVTDTATGVVGTSPASGTLAVTLDSVTDTATGSVSVHGTASNTLGATADTASGQTAIAGTLSKSLDAATDSATGTVTSNSISGTLSQTTGPVVSSATAAVAVTGAASDSLAAATSAAAGGVAAQGQSSSTLSADTVVGHAVTDTRGSLASSLASQSVDAAGTVASTNIDGSLEKTLDALIDSAHAVANTNAAAAISLDTVTEYATGVVYDLLPIRAYIADDYQARVLSDLSLGLNVVEPSRALAVVEPVTSVLSVWESTLVVTEPLRSFVVVEPTLEILMSLIIKAGDRYPSFAATLTTTADFDLATATGVKFVWRLGPDGTRNEGAMTIVDAPTKKVAYAWGPTDTITPGKYEAEIEVTFPGGLVMTLPNQGFYKFTIAQTI